MTDSTDDDARSGDARHGARIQGFVLSLSARSAALTTVALAGFDFLSPADWIAIAVLAGLFAAAILLVTRPMRERRAAAPADESLPALPRWEQLADSATEHALVLLDPDGWISGWNTGAERLYGWRASQVTGEPLARLYPLAEVERGNPALALSTAAREGRHVEEAWRVRRDGTRVWVEAALTPIVSREGTLTGFALVERDASARRVLEGDRAFELSRARRAREAADARAERAERAARLAAHARHAHAG
jgi:PAS domain S-box-containing protein